MSGRTAWCWTRSRCAIWSCRAAICGLGDRATLFRCARCTVTPMGKRLLRAWMLRPSIDLAEIKARLDAVEAHGRNCRARRAAARAGRRFSIWSACSAGSRWRPPIRAICWRWRLRLAKLPAVRGALAQFAAERLQALHDAMRRTRRNCARRIDATIEDEPPLTLADGGVIRAGVDASWTNCAT